MKQPAEAAARFINVFVQTLLDDDLDAAVLRLAHVVAGLHQQAGSRPCRRP